MTLIGKCPQYRRNAMEKSLQRLIVMISETIKIICNFHHMLKNSLQLLPTCVWMTLYPSFIVDCQVSASPLKNQITMEVTTICCLNGAKISSRSSRQIFHVNTLITLSSNMATDTYSISEQNPVQQTVETNFR